MFCTYIIKINYNLKSIDGHNNLIIDEWNKYIMVVLWIYLWFLVLENSVYNNNVQIANMMDDILLYYYTLISINNNKKILC